MKGESLRLLLAFLSCPNSDCMPLAPHIQPPVTQFLFELLNGFVLDKLMQTQKVNGIEERPTHIKNQDKHI